MKQVRFPQNPSQRIARVLLAASLLLFLLVPLTVLPAWSMADEGTAGGKAGSQVTGDGSCDKQEVVYAKLSAQGATQALFVVNAFQAAAGSTIKDYGSYTSVTNLTDDGALAQSSDGVVFSSTGESFSYQGDLATKDLPWIISIDYTLDGQPIAPADLAGRQGELKISFTTTKNPAIDPGYWDNYLLQATCNLPLDKASDVKTEEGSIALSGSDTAVTFMVMPGKEGSCSLTAKVKDFEMDGMSFAAVPFSMTVASPDTAGMIADFDALIEGTRALASGSRDLAAGAQEMSAGLSALAPGARQLDAKAQEIAQGLGRYSGGVTQTSDGLNTLSGGLVAASNGLNTLSAQGGALSSVLATSVTDPLDSFIADGNLTEEQKRKLASIQAALKGTSPGIYNSLQDYTAGVTDAASGISDLSTGITGAAGALTTLSTEGGALSRGMNSYASGMTELASSIGRVSGGSTELEQGASSLADGSDGLYRETQKIPDTLQAEIDAMMADYDKSDFTPQSFTSSKNTGVTLVQFVMTTDSIKTVEPKKEAPVEEEETILTRFFALFS